MGASASLAYHPRSNITAAQPREHNQTNADYGPLACSQTSPPPPTLLMSLFFKVPGKIKYRIIKTH